METGAPPEGPFRAVAFIGIQLGASVHLPLKAKAASILLSIHETHDAVHHGILPTTANASHPTSFVFEVVATREAAEHGQDFVSESNLVAIWRYGHKLLRSNSVLPSRAGGWAVVGSRFAPWRTCIPP